MSGRARSLLLAALALAAACPAPSPPPPKPPVAKPPSKHLVASSRIPFHVAGNLPDGPSGLTGSAVDLGPDVGLSLWYGEALSGHNHEVAGSLVAVAALPDRLVVVYPSAAQAGFDVAVGGLNLSWTAQHLSDIPRPNMGAVDAIANNAGGVFVALRERFPPPDDAFASPLLHFLELSNDGAIVSDELIPGAGVSVQWWELRCPDVQIGESLAGDVDVFTLGPTHARRPAGATLWDLQVLDPHRDPNQLDLVDDGCRNRVAYDEADLPQMIELGRALADVPPEQPPIASSTTELPRDTWGDDVSRMPSTFTLGYFMGADGRWRRPGPSAGLALVANFWHEGGFDVVTSPDGAVFSGPNMSLVDPQMSFPMSSFVRDAATVADFSEFLPVPQVEDTALAGTELNVEGNTDKMLFAECGGLIAFGASDRRFQPQEHTYFFDEGATDFECAGQLQAPVFAEPLHENERLRTAVFAHGRTPYNVAVCLDDDAALAVCVGGYAVVTGGDVAPEDDAPELVDSEPADGAVDVATETAEVVMHLSRPLTKDERVTAQVANVAKGIDVNFPHEIVTVTVDGDTVHVGLPPEGLQAGAHWRVALTVSRGTARFPYVGQKRPVVTFRTTGPIVADPRLVARDIPCVAGRVDGVCDLGTAPFAAGTVLELSVDYDEPDNDVGRPHVTDPNGDPAPVTSTTRLSGGLGGAVQDITFLSALTPSTRYLITIPNGARDSYGALLPADELVYAFTTEAP